MLFQIYATVSNSLALSKVYSMRRINNLTGSYMAVWSWPCLCMSGFRRTYVNKVRCLNSTEKELSYIAIIKF